MKTGKLSAGQLRKIWAMAREMDLDEDLLRAKVKSLTGSESISNLTVAQASLVINSLTGSTGKAPVRLGWASKKQLWKINKLTEELGWSNNPKRITGYIRKYAKVDNIKWLTSAQAWRVIEGLKKLRERAETTAVKN